DGTAWPGVVGPADGHDNSRRRPGAPDAHLPPLPGVRRSPAKPALGVDHLARNPRAVRPCEPAHDCCDVGGRAPPPAGKCAAESLTNSFGGPSGVNRARIDRVHGGRSDATRLGARLRTLKLSHVADRVALIAGTRHNVQYRGQWY